MGSRGEDMSNTSNTPEPLQYGRSARSRRRRAKLLALLAVVALSAYVALRMVGPVAARYQQYLDQSRALVYARPPDALVYTERRQDVDGRTEPWTTWSGFPEHDHEQFAARNAAEPSRSVSALSQGS